MDFGDLGSWAQAAAGFAGALAVVFAAKTGAATVESWLGQRRAERQIDAAERILALAYRLKREFEAIRSPAQYVGEIERAENLLGRDGGFTNLPANRKKQQVTGQIYVTRLAERGEHWNELFECVPLAKAYFGDEVEAAIFQFWLQRGVVDVAARMLADGDLDRELRDELEGDIWDGWNRARQKSDRINDAIAAATVELEKALLPVLRNQPRGSPATKKARSSL